MTRNWLNTIVRFTAGLLLALTAAPPVGHAVDPF